MPPMSPPASSEELAELDASSSTWGQYHQRCPDRSIWRRVNEPNSRRISSSGFSGGIGVVFPVVDEWLMANGWEMVRTPPRRFSELPANKKWGWSFLES